MFAPQTFSGDEKCFYLRQERMWWKTRNGGQHGRGPGARLRGSQRPLLFLEGPWVDKPSRGQVRSALRLRHNPTAHLRCLRGYLHHCGHFRSYWLRLIFPRVLRSFASSSSTDTELRPNLPF